MEAATPAQAVAAVRAADAAAEPLLVLGAGSNLVVADAGFPGTVLRIAARGIRQREDGERAWLEVAAGEPWDAVVERSVDAGLAGLECLSGIPGLAGATPIQNVGAYGAEVSETITAVRVYDRRRRRTVTLGPEQCGFGYRTSALKGNDDRLVLAVTFALDRDPRGRPVRYAELARALGIEPGERAPLAQVREAVLSLRRGKGMVLDPDDPDSVSAGSFFTNPVLSAAAFEALEGRVRARLGGEARAPRWPQPGGRVKTSAAWLIERAGFGPGYGDGPAGLSAKHTLAIVNRGGATTADVVALARELRAGVLAEFGVELEPEPKLVGVTL